MSLRSFSERSTLLRSGPAITRSIDSSSAAMVILVPLARAVSRAASLITLARSAPVEPAGAQQRGVEDIGPVGGRDDDDPALDVEPVQLDEQLVEGLLALVMTAAEPGATVPADRVDLVHEHDR